MKSMQTPKCFLAGSSVYTQTREPLAVYVMLLCKWRLRSCNISRVEHSSWLDRDHRNPMVMDLQELRMSLFSLCPQYFSYRSPNPVVFHSYHSQPIMLFLHHRSSGFCPVPSSPFLWILPSLPSYLFTVSKHKLSHLDVLCGLVPLCAAACFAPRSASKVTLLLHRHFASKGSPVQHYYLEMDMMEAAWWAAVSKHLPSIFKGP